MYMYVLTVGLSLSLFIFQIEQLEEKLTNGEVLDGDQAIKVSRKQDVIDQLEQLKLDQ